MKLIDLIPITKSDTKLNELSEKKLAQAKKLADLIVTTIARVDPNLDYKVLAAAVADIMKDEYGEHLFRSFRGELDSHLQSNVQERFDPSNPESFEDLEDIDIFMTDLRKEIVVKVSTDKSKSAQQVLLSKQDAEKVIKALEHTIRIM